MLASWDDRIPSMGLHYIAAFLDPSLKNLKSLEDYLETRKDSLSQFIFETMDEIHVKLEKLLPTDEDRDLEVVVATKPVQADVQKAKSSKEISTEEKALALKKKKDIAAETDKVIIAAIISAVAVGAQTEQSLTVEDKSTCAPGSSISELLSPKFENDFYQSKRFELKPNFSTNDAHRYYEDQPIEKSFEENGADTVRAIQDHCSELGIDLTNIKCCGCGCDGPIGKLAAGPVHLMTPRRFVPLKTDAPPLPDAVVKKLSWDQKVLYSYTASWCQFRVDRCRLNLKRRKSARSATPDG
ncbi:hypothetical protein ACHWQZ_G017404 [Mnemiopsis leidyi]